MWMIIKSAGDDFSFTLVLIPGKMGHGYQYAKKLANDVTNAMKLAQQIATLENQSDAVIEVDEPPE